MRTTVRFPPGSVGGDVGRTNLDFPFAIPMPSISLAAVRHSCHGNIQIGLEAHQSDIREPLNRGGTEISRLVVIEIVQNSKVVTGMHVENSDMG